MAKMINDRRRVVLKAIIPVAISAACFVCTIPSLASTLNDPGGLSHETIARSIAYVAWRNTSVAAVHYPFNPLLVALIILASAALSLGFSLKIGYPRWYIPVFVVATFFAGTLFFTPQILGHYHFQQPSTSYFLHNIGVSAVGSLVTTATVFFYRLAKPNNQPRIAWLVLSYSWTIVAFHLLASFFYMFRPFVAVE